jgi:Cu-processing system ATP-binding protein
MVISSHILAEIQQRVDRLAIMAAGRVQASGTVQALREEMNLPLCFTVRVARAADFATLRSALGHLPVSAVEASRRPADGALPAHAKMAVIASPGRGSAAGCATSRCANPRSKTSSSAFGLRGRAS